MFTSISSKAEQNKTRNLSPFFSTASGKQNHQQTAFFSPTIQPKLTINQPDDEYEQEADAMADRVVQAKPLSTTDTISRKCADCEKEEKVQRMTAPEEEELQSKPLMRKSNTQGGYSASPQLASQLNSSKGGGNALPKGTLSSMNQAFGTDFSHVRVHTNNQAQDMSEGIQAKAFTHGSDIYFNKGQYNPQSTEGKRLLGHELTHVVQQNKNRNLIQRTIGDGHDLVSPRFKGNIRLEAAYDGERSITRGSRGEHINRIQQALIDSGFSLVNHGVDGIFGNETLQALKSFQEVNGLSKDGIIGKNTMTQFDKIFSYGSTGVDVDNQNDRRGERRTEREERRDRRRRTKPGGRNRSREEGGDFDSDWAGRAILYRYLRGGADWTINNNSSWSNYMMASTRLKTLLAKRVENLAREVRNSGKSGSISETFHAAVENGEGIIGYQYLHGTNASVGDFQIIGTSSLNGTNITLDLSYHWNDVIDPNPQYSTDNIKSLIAEAITLGQADPYILHIIWNSTCTIEFDSTGNIISKTGYPFN